MKNFLKFCSPLCFLLLFSCSTDSSSSSPSTAATNTPAEPKAEQGPLLSQDAPVVRVEFAATGTENIATYLVNSKNIDKEKVEAQGLTKLEAHIAKMMAISSGKCDQGADQISFALIDSENKLIGRYDFPCGYIRKVYRMIGLGPATEYPTIKGSNSEVISTNQLGVNAGNLASFKNIVRGLEPKEYKGIKIGEVVK